MPSITRFYQFVALSIFFFLAISTATQAEQARGVVFHDLNRDGARQPGEPGIPGVRVSNGVEITATDDSGTYQLEVDDDTILFVIKPRNWQTQLNGKRLPQFYYIHKPDGSPDDDFEFSGVEPTGPLPDSVDFALTPVQEPAEFSIIVMGDPQPYDEQQVHYYANDVIAELVDSKAVFGISLGDIVGDKLSLFDKVNAVQATVGVPWYNVHGNHDMNYRSPDDEHADETFERVYGPTNYAFQWASVHFVVLDNVRWQGFAMTKEGKVDHGNYLGGLNDRQLRFVSNYVAGVPRADLIVICTHIPLINPTSAVHGTPELDKLLKILANHPHQLSFSAHTHFNRHDFAGKAVDRHTEHHHATNEKHAHHHFQLHHHHNVGTASGSWYRGPKDEQGFPMTPMRDGVPNGYFIATFSGNKYRLRYKAARLPADYQLSIHAPEKICVSELSATEILVNVFNGNEKTMVNLRIRGSRDWIPMTKAEREDPAYRAMYERDLADEDRPHTELPKPVLTPHIWTAKLPASVPAGVQILEVEAKDMFGQVDRGIRLIEIAADPPTPEQNSND